MTEPDLHFSPGGTLEGFTSAGVQAFNELNPDAIVRELIQNSLDAVREDGREEAMMRFELSEIALAEVPAIETYRERFDRAVASQRQRLGGELPAQAAMVADAIRDELEKDTVQVLSVLDNGLGLDEQRMLGLLADGLSVKTSAGAGAVGNGHLTAIPASNLRYVLYGGLRAGGRQIATGHAVLASFADEQGRRMGKDGYYALSVSPSMETPYDFVPAGAMAPLIKTRLDWIAANFDSGTGAAVIIPGFNGFREPGELWALISKAAACSFFAAIADGHLQIAYQDGSGEQRLDQSTIAGVFAGELAGERRARHFLSGGRAAQAYQTATRGRPYSVDVGCGRVEVRLLDSEDGRSRIDLCRNGMWISDRLPRLNISKFTDRKPFHALIKVTARDGDIHSLIRKSEGPLHNHIEAKKWLQPHEKRRLENAFKKIADFLLDTLERFAQETFAVDDFLNIHIEDSGAVGGLRAGNIGKFEEEPARPPRSPKGGSRSKGGAEGDGNGAGDGGGGGGDSNPNAFRRSGNAVPFGAVPVPTGLRACLVELHPQAALNADTEAEIRFILDENIDTSCDRSSEEQFVSLKAVALNGMAVADEQLIKGDAGVLGVRLGRFAPDEPHRLSFEYELPAGFAVPAGERVFLRAEIVCRRKQTGQQP